MLGQTPTRTAVIAALVLVANLHGARSDAVAHDKIKIPASRHGTTGHGGALKHSSDSKINTPSHWRDYVPQESALKSKSLAEELVEAHERARLLQERVGQQNHARLTAPKGTNSANKRVESAQKGDEKSDGAIKSAAKRSGKAVKKAVRSASKSAGVRIHQNDDTDDDDEYDDEVYDDDEDEYEGAEDYEDYTARRTARRRASARLRRKRRLQAQTSTRSRPVALVISVWFLTVQIFWATIGAIRWTGRSIMWTPMTYVGAAVQWSAHTSWRTTRWTGQHAFIGPVRTVSAPLIYLVDGLLFIFVWLPARALRVIVHELYPV
jgi:hypothetical protein